MTKRPDPIVVIADGDVSFQRFLGPLLDRLGLRTAAVATGEAALRSTRELNPALVVLAVRLPDISGFEICRELRDEFGEELPIILVSGEKTDDLHRAAGLLLGADDYLAKPIDPSLLLAQVRRLVRRAPTAPEPVDEAPFPDTRFTAREQEILVLLADGNDRASIARTLVISPRTVGSHIQRLLIKLGVHSQAQVVAAAYRDGLIPPRGPDAVNGA
jgi:DNA-binding NarL/FixJ family response regulator